MPTGPQGQKRPADAIGLAVMIGKIATGEMEDDMPLSRMTIAVPTKTRDQCTCAADRGARR